MLLLFSLDHQFHKCDFLVNWKTIRFLRMSYLSDTLTIGVLLVLLFGSISLYLYTRIQQAEQKIHLLESILLDLKMSTEIKSYTELPADQDDAASQASHVSHVSHVSHTSHASLAQHVPQTPHTSLDLNDTYVPLDDSSESITEYTSLDDALDTSADSLQEHTVISLPETANTAAVTASTSVAYESMTLKDLQSLARTRGISGASSMKKGPIIEALKTSDRNTVIKPGSLGTTGANSFLETSALVSDVSV